ncbi:MAG: hypothetical protein KKF48_05265 [Nanoarchaeota archaeon]|nr:hypothetical protein [Nanoarchaeota archaeon]MBU1028428.1 hypothetical protein [Nanoarchaeota archaeon]
MNYELEKIGELRIHEDNIIKNISKMYKDRGINLDLDELLYILPMDDIANVHFPTYALAVEDILDRLKKEGVKIPKKIEALVFGKGELENA